MHSKVLATRPAAAVVEVVSTPSLPARVAPWIDGREGEAFDRRGRAIDAWWNPQAIPVDLHAALPAVIERWSAAVQPASRELTITYLARLAAHYPSDRSERQWQVVFEDCADDLSDIPPDILLDAIRAHRRASNFFPKISELLGLVQPQIDRRRWQLERMRKLSQLPSCGEEA